MSSVKLTTEQLNQIVADNGEGFYIAVGPDSDVIDCFKVIVPDNSDAIVVGFGDKSEYATKDLARLFDADAVIDFVKMPVKWFVES